MTFESLFEPARGVPVVAVQECDVRTRGCLGPVVLRGCRASTSVTSDYSKSWVWGYNDGRDTSVVDHDALEVGKRLDRQRIEGIVQQWLAVVSRDDHGERR
jgi:hypothetical protein